MTPSESTENPNLPDSAGINNGPDDTAPDSDTQSSAASQDGGRTTQEGSRAPDDPAEGA